jgi:phospholipase C
VLSNSPYRDEKLDDAGTPQGNPVRPDGPIKHVIYIVKENRTYDQVLGDMKEGNGDAVAGALRREGHAQSAQAGARVRAAR